MHACVHAGTWESRTSDRGSSPPASFEDERDFRGPAPGRREDEEEDDEDLRFPRSMLPAVRAPCISGMPPDKLAASGFAMSPSKVTIAPASVGEYEQVCRKAKKDVRHLLPDISMRLSLSSARFVSVERVCSRTPSDFVFAHSFTRIGIPPSSETTARGF
jgi:hypothetical protein